MENLGVSPSESIVGWIELLLLGGADSSAKYSGLALTSSSNTRRTAAAAGTWRAATTTWAATATTNAVQSGRNGVQVHSATSASVVDAGY